MTNLQNGSPVFLAPDWRYAGDDWMGDNALTFVVYETAPVYAADGVTLVTPGVTRDLTGCTVAGTLRYQGRCARGQDMGAGSALVTPAGVVLDGPNGVIALSLSAAQTIFPRQPLGLWGDPGRALLLVQPRVVGPAGAVTVGLQPLFVF